MSLLSNKGNTTYTYTEGHKVDPPEKEKYTKIVIPYNITNIGPRAFDYFVNVKDVVFINQYNITPPLKISDFAFQGCIELEKITIPLRVNEINEGVFADCSNLKSVEFLRGITDGKYKLQTIKRQAFKNCISLVDITIPPSVQTIEQYAFIGCSSLKEVTFLSSDKDKTFMTDNEGLQKRIFKEAFPPNDDMIFNEKTRDAFFRESSSTKLHPNGGSRKKKKSTKRKKRKTKKSTKKPKKINKRKKSTKKSKKK